MKGFKSMICQISSNSKILRFLPINMLLILMKECCRGLCTIAELCLWKNGILICVSAPTIVLCLKYTIFFSSPLHTIFYFSDGLDIICLSKQYLLPLNIFSLLS